jgi:hypothetical protein
VFPSFVRLHHSCVSIVRGLRDRPSDSARRRESPPPSTTIYASATCATPPRSTPDPQAVSGTSSGGHNLHNRNDTEPARHPRGHLPGSGAGKASRLQRLHDVPCGAASWRRRPRDVPHLPRSWPRRRSAAWAPRLLLWPLNYNNANLTVFITGQ